MQELARATLSGAHTIKTAGSKEKPGDYRHDHECRADCFGGRGSLAARWLTPRQPCDPACPPSSGSISWATFLNQRRHNAAALLARALAVACPSLLALPRLPSSAVLPVCCRALQPLPTHPLAASKLPVHACEISRHLAQLVTTGWLQQQTGWTSNRHKSCSSEMENG